MWFQVCAWYMKWEGTGSNYTGPLRLRSHFNLITIIPLETGGLSKTLYIFVASMGMLQCFP